MLHHVVIFRWNPGTTSEQVEALKAALATMPAAVPELTSYLVGVDLGLNSPPGDFAVVATTADQAGWNAYNEHPEHQRIRAEILLPIVAERMSVQFED